jgi:hypothetical protein
MVRVYSYLVLGTALLFTSSRADCLNEVAQYHGDNDRTITLNISKSKFTQRHISCQNFFFL